MRCIVVDDDSMARKAIEQMIKTTDFLELKESFSSPVQAFNYLEENPVELMFLDIEMPEMTGLEMLDSLNNIQPMVIFTTGNKDYALDVFDHKTIDYLVKPVGYPQFLKAALKAKDLYDRIQKNNSNTWDFLLLRSEGVFNKTFFKDIIFIEALGDYIHIHTTAKKTILHTTMKTFAGKLPPNFIRVHRSFIINTDYLNSIEENTISLNSGTLIPLGVSYREDFFKRLKV